MVPKLLLANFCIESIPVNKENLASSGRTQVLAQPLGGGIFIGKTKTDLSNNYDVQDMKKSMDLPAPTDPILTLFGRNYENCNSSLEFNMDDEISRKFHELFADDHRCHIPFLGGDRYVTPDLPQNKFCTRMADYNTTQGVQFFVSYPF